MLFKRQMNHMNSARDPIQYETDQEVVKVEVFHGMNSFLFCLSLRKTSMNLF